MIVTLVVLFAVAGFSLAMLMMSSAGQRTSIVNSKKYSAQALADAAVEVGKNWCQTQWANQSGTAVSAMAADNLNALQNPAKWNIISISGYAARWALIKVNPTLSPTPNGSSPCQYVTGTNGWYADGTDGVRTFHYTYAVYGRAEFTTKQSAGDVNSIAAQSSQIIENQVTPLFQYAVFYNSDLEILPGPNMTLTGRVHSNRDMYLGCGGTMTLATNYVRAVGKLYRKRKDDGTVTAGTVLVQNMAKLGDSDPTNDYNTTLPNGTGSQAKIFSKADMAALGINTAEGFDSTFGGYDYNGNGVLTDASDWNNWGAQAMSLYGGTVQTSDMQVPAAQPPQQNLTLDPFVAKTGGDYDVDSSGNYYAVTPGTGNYTKGYLHSKAGLIIKNGVAYAPDGTVLTTALKSGTITSISIWDARENKSVPQVKVDVALLKQSLEQSGSTGTLGTLKNSWNGLLYITDMTATTTSLKGVLLANGTELPNNPITSAKQGLTLASNLPVYVQGDYNTKVNGNTSATNDPAFRKPASIIADAVNLLSNSWNNTKTSGSSLPTASNTTFNTAMIAGNVVTAGTKYSGGLENLPRFHEDWSNKNATIAGSFVNLWASKLAKGAWLYGPPVYNAPNRLWDFDPNYKDFTKIPPFTPLVVNIKEVSTQQ
ncbi:MAG: hypothetical protein HY286_13660 [Planctomycetes bacterium]|nr:hypothetical protein [Planctomycetota bacterium]